MRASSYFIILVLAVYNGDVVETARFPAFFIPEEWQTILSVFYSHLPPVKIGSDKRFGVGFRLGKNADAQILVELGPQSDTQPLADAGSGFSKRESELKTDNRRQKSAGRLVNNSMKQQKTADAKNSAFEIKNKNERIPKTIRKTAEQSPKTTDTYVEIEIKTEPTTIKKKTKRKRAQKKENPVDKLTEDPFSPTNNAISTRNQSQKRPETFLNNFMTWLNRFNQQRYVTTLK